MQNIFKKKKPPMPETPIVPQQNIIIPEVKNVVIPKNRQPTFTIAVGKKGIGKTFVTKKKVKEYVKGNALTGTKPRKVIYFDVNNESKDIKTIPVDSVFDPKEINWIAVFSSPRSKVEIRRVVPIKKDGTPMTNKELNDVLAYLILHFRGGLLVVEDPARYISDSIDTDLAGGLATIRHANADVIAHYQWKSKALNPKLFGNVNYFRLHKTNDDFIDYIDRVKGVKQIFFLAETLERYMNKNLRDNATKAQLANEKQIPIETFYCVIDMDSTKIRGAFSVNDFKKAIELYISANSKKELNPLLNEINVNTGKPKYTFQEAYNIKFVQLFNEYFGNNLNT